MRLYNVRLVSRRSFVAVSTGSVGRGGVQALESMQQQTLCAAGKRASGTLLSATTVHRHVSVICLVSLTLVVASTHANKASNAIHPQNSRKFFRNKSMKGSEQSESKSVRIESLPLDQLRMLQKQIAQELEGKQKAAQVLASTASSFNSSRSAVQDLSKVEEGEKMMVPLTESLYVEGFVHQKDKILVDIGTGYFAERTCEEAADFCSRKIQGLKQNIDQIGEQIREKEQLQGNIEAIAQEKMRTSQQPSTANTMTKPV